MGKPLSFLKALDGIAFELLSTFMILNLYPLGLREDKDPALLPYQMQKRPVLLLHGIFHNRSAFFGIKRRLQRLGWEYIYTTNLSTYKKGIAELAEEVSQKVNTLLKNSQSPKIDIVAHSLGGVIARYYIQFLGGHEKIRHCITLGTPHRGTLLSYFGIGKSIKDLRRTSEIIKKINSKPLPKSVKFTSFWSPYDTMVIPAKNAKIKQDAKNVDHIQNIKVYHTGHAGLLFSKDVCYKIASLLDSSRKYATVIEHRRSILRNLALKSFLST